MISEAISKLPRLSQQVIVLRDVEGWSAGEVAAILGLSDVNQRVHLHRARAALRSRLEKERDGQ